MIQDALSKVEKSTTESLKESDKMFVELEEEMMKFEEQQKGEDRRFQLQMMQLLVGSARPPHWPVVYHHHPYPADYSPYNPRSKYNDDSGDAENA